mgnify:CR=1 FL=1
MNIFAGSFANSVFFYVYTDGKAKYNYDPANPNSLTTVIISLRASIIAMIVTTPMWVVKTRLALFKENINNTSGKNTSSVIWHVVKDMAVNEGPSSFFKGIGPALILSSYGLVQMYSYENINRYLGY